MVNDIVDEHLVRSRKIFGAAEISPLDEMHGDLKSPALRTYVAHRARYFSTFFSFINGTRRIVSRAHEWPQFPNPRNDIKTRGVPDRPARGRISKIPMGENASRLFSPGK